MKEQNVEANNQQDFQATVFDYDNTDWPRDYDIRIEVAEQREVLEQV